MSRRNDNEAGETRRRHQTKTRKFEGETFVFLIGKLSKAADKCSAQGFIEENVFVWVFFFVLFFVLVWFVQLHRIKVASDKKERQNLCAL